jgi:hypothetical protein
MIEPARRNRRLSNFGGGRAPVTPLRLIPDRPFSLCIDIGARQAVKFLDIKYLDIFIAG